jgi:hypothetical protein
MAERQINCYRCGGDGHFARNCPQGTPSRHPGNTGSTGNTGSSNNNCYNCGEPGHISRDCTEKGAPRRGGNTNSGRADLKCYSCGNYGHMARDCPSGMSLLIQNLRDATNATTAARVATSPGIVPRAATAKREREETAEKGETDGVETGAITARASVTTATRWAISPASALVNICPLRQR